MAVLLGGRAAEMLVFDEISTGAGDDLDKATEIARNMVTRYGMDPDLGHATYVEAPPRFLGDAAAQNLRGQYSEETAQTIDRAVRALIADAFDRATEILSRHREPLDRTAQRLLEKETLMADELPELTETKEPTGG